MKALFTGILFVCSIILCSPAMAQNATLWDAETGQTISLTRVTPLDFFNTEGPAWDISCNDQGRGGTMTCMGKLIPIPWLINGEPMVCEATADGYEDSDGGEILSDEFCKMTDHASTKGSLSAGLLGAVGDLGRQGAVRSIISTQEARSRMPGVDESNLTMANPGSGAQQVLQAEIESNFCSMVAAVYPAHASVLPADFMARCGMDTADPATWVQHMMTGGTFKSAGHTYVDAAGNQYLIPDEINVYELSENTNAGSVTNLAPGTDGNPDSFVVTSGASADQLVIFNPDPRFPSGILGVADQHIPRETWIEDIQTGGNTGIDMVGYVVGEHVIFAMELFTDLVNADGVIEVSVERWRFRDGGNEIRFRGACDEPNGLAMSATALGCSGGQNFAIPFGVDLEADAATGAGHFAARLEFDLIPGASTADVTHIRIDVIAVSNSQLMFSETFSRNEVDPDNPTATVCDGAAGFEEICDDNEDNDDDGDTDCEDADCQTQAFCGGFEDAAAGECEDGIDNDADGLGDCADSDCNGVLGGPVAEGCLVPDQDFEESCGDGLDNDGDGQADCADADCEGEPGPDGTNPCAAPPEAPEDDGAPEEDDAP